MGIKTINPRDSSFVVLADIKLHLKVDVADDDAYITALAAAAADVIQHRTQSSVGVQTLELALDAFPDDAIELPRGPVSGVVSVKYYDVAGTLQTLTAYSTDDHSETFWVLPEYGTSWPSTRDVANAVLIQYTAGTSPLQPAVHAALLLLVGHWYENREAVIISNLMQEVPLGVAALLAPTTVWSM